ncbi:arginine--tRNA ligase [Thermoflavimicrobium daqui]|uniref:Arginine--tRNA ligase n=1 Tax=Thermoflavimicrobium daqui TaxID=2137476 RepID=A0A364K3N1_9BACL|nr:arginine--tRNA ligase [Thermoflavimicrobium daqui]RAL23368.1 arginine--tRNA ligase [Thermoflavimicrobium daqui]
MNSLEQRKETLREEIRQAILKANLLPESDVPEVHLEVPREKEHGDWATNIAMKLTRVARRNPREIAAAIVENLDQRKASIREVQIAGPGFINFFLDRSFLIKIIDEVREKKEEYGKSYEGQGKKVNIEFVSANPTGSLHLGHARGAAVGDALCNILDAAGYDVTREYYINDAGNQMQMMALSIEARYFELLGKEHSFPEDGYRGQEMIQIAKEIVQDQGDKLLEMESAQRLNYLKQVGRDKLLAKIKSDLERFRVPFNVWFSELSMYESGVIEETINELQERGYTYEQDGALWLKTTEFGDDKDRVLVKKDGSYTYFTPDIAYHRNKFGRGHQLLINIWGADHHGYIPRMKSALAALGYNSDQLEIVISQMVKLYQGGELVKMSKRTGKAVTLQELMNEVGVDAARYFFTMRSPDTHLDFDMDLAISKSNENPVYYVQYAHARITSVFRQAKEKGLQTTNEPTKLVKLQLEQELDLLQKLAEFPRDIAQAAAQLAPHRVIRYLHELATQFHSYYNAERVITEDIELSEARLTLLDAIQQVIRNGLKLVGVSAPDRM